MNNLVTIRTYDNYVQAHVTKCRLEEEGISVYLKDEQTVTMYWIWSQALGGIKLQVLEKDVAAAESILEEDEKQFDDDKEQPAYFDEDRSQLDPNNKICIYCGSKNTKAEQYDKGWAYTAMLFLGFPVSVKSEKWHCFHCSKKF